MAKSTENTETMQGMEKEFTFVNVKDAVGNVYKLQFNRRISEAMEREGFVFDMDNKPQTSIRTLFRGAFRMNHKGMMPEKIDAIWDFQKGKDKLIALLYRLYLKPLEELMAEPESNEDENPTWEAI